MPFFFAPKAKQPPCGNYAPQGGETKGKRMALKSGLTQIFATGACFLERDVKRLDREQILLNHNPAVITLLIQRHTESREIRSEEHTS